MDRRITVLLADDHPLLREALKNVLSRQADINVVGEASNGEEAVCLACELVPDVAILDLSMPGLSGIEATRLIKSRCPEVAILVLTVHDEDEYTRQIPELGVVGYVTKDAPIEEVVRAVRSVAQGDIAFSPRVLRSIIRHRKPNGDSACEGEVCFTKRELEILRLTARGLTNRDVSAICGLSPRTIRGYLETIFSKLHVSNRTEAVAEALRRGILVVDDLRVREQHAWTAPGNKLD